MGRETNKAPMFASLVRSCEWLALRGVDRQPLDLLEEAAEGRIQIFAAVPEGSRHGFTAPPSMTTRGKTFTFSTGHRFKLGEMVAVPPDNCVQFLQTGEAHIRDAGGQEWIDAGFPDEWAILLKVLHIDAFRVRGCDLEAFADAQALTPATGASAPAVALPAAVETKDERSSRIRARVDYWKGQGVRDFTARVAKEEALSVERVRQILRGGKTKPTGDAKKAKQRKKATFCGGLIPAPGRTR